MRNKREPKNKAGGSSDSDHTDKPVTSSAKLDMQRKKLLSMELDSDTDVILEIECGPNKGFIHLGKLQMGSKGACVFFEDAWLTPNEFQFVSGRETAKDWKRSIKHFGKSLKLLMAKGFMSLTPPECHCEHCTGTAPEGISVNGEPGEKTADISARTALQSHALASTGGNISVLSPASLLKAKKRPQLAALLLKGKAPCKDGAPLGAITSPEVRDEYTFPSDDEGFEQRRTAAAVSPGRDERRLQASPVGSYGHEQFEPPHHGAAPEVVSCSVSSDTGHERRELEPVSGGGTDEQQQQQSRHAQPSADSQRSQPDVASSIVLKAPSDSQTNTKVAMDAPTSPPSSLAKEAGETEAPLDADNDDQTVLSPKKEARLTNIIKELRTYKNHLCHRTDLVGEENDKDNDEEKTASSPHSPTPPPMSSPREAKPSEPSRDAGHPQRTVATSPPKDPTDRRHADTSPRAESHAHRSPISRSVARAQPTSPRDTQQKKDGYMDKLKAHAASVRERYGKGDVSPRRSDTERSKAAGSGSSRAHPSSLSPGHARGTPVKDSSRESARAAAELAACGMSAAAYNESLSSMYGVGLGAGLAPGLGMSYMPYPYLHPGMMQGSLPSTSLSAGALANPMLYSSLYGMYPNLAANMSNYNTTSLYSGGYGHPSVTSSSSTSPTVAKKRVSDRGALEGRRGEEHHRRASGESHQTSPRHHGTLGSPVSSKLSPRSQALAHMPHLSHSYPANLDFTHKSKSDLDKEGALDLSVAQKRPADFLSPAPVPKRLRESWDIRKPEALKPGIGLDINERLSSQHPRIEGARTSSSRGLDYKDMNSAAAAVANAHALANPSLHSASVQALMAAGGAYHTGGAYGAALVGGVSPAHLGLLSHPYFHPYTLT